MSLPLRLRFLKDPWWRWKDAKVTASAQQRYRLSKLLKAPESGDRSKNRKEDTLLHHYIQKLVFNTGIKVILSLSFFSWITTDRKIVPIPLRRSCSNKLEKFENTWGWKASKTKKATLEECSSQRCRSPKVLTSRMLSSPGSLLHTRGNQNFHRSDGRTQLPSLVLSR